ncbi:MAG TPA: hypothetical protein PK673_07455, partial [Paludibacteraceae bacterium]|nr:hypothetical protein [Paludibacteraceae bacterium]
IMCFYISFFQNNFKINELMKRVLSFFVMCLLPVFVVFGGPKSKANKETERFRYELECVNNGTEGFYLVKVWSFSKKANVAAEQSKKNAVHGVIFKGYVGKSGCVSQRPLAKTPGVEYEKAAYFKEFFKDGGEYMKYVTLTEGTREIVKIGKEYKVGVVVSVAKDDLRKALEAAGVVKSLGSGF